jgi:hypothetical protein
MSSVSNYFVIHILLIGKPIIINKFYIIHKRFYLTPQLYFSYIHVNYICNENEEAFISSTFCNKPFGYIKYI